jgi:hypothetical protein
MGMASSCVNQCREGAVDNVRHDSPKEIEDVWDMSILYGDACLFNNQTLACGEYKFDSLAEWPEKEK